MQQYLAKGRAYRYARWGPYTCFQRVTCNQWCV